jgi:hypothetical protein
MRHRRYEGVHYARTQDGSELPVIDVTHPAFALPHDEARMEKGVARFVRNERARARIPRSIQRAILQLASRRSRLARAFYDASEGVVGGMALYAAKLGPTMLGPGYSGFIDRLIAGAPPSRLARLRLEDMARLLADGLGPILAAKSGAPLHLFNIAGGPAADSWNALLWLQKERRGALGQRKIAINVLDRDEEGPAFGARAVAALRCEGGPLRELDVTFRRIAYDWRDTGALGALLGEIDTERDAVAVSSEGGLFEYGSDDEIVANLDAIRARTPSGCVVAGSVTRAEGPPEFLREFAVRPRTLRAFGALAQRGGWTVARVIERALCYDVRLSKIA